LAAVLAFSGIFALVGSADASDIPAPLLAASCDTCHGPQGRSPGAIPAIAGLDAPALRASLEGFKQDRIPATVMNRIAKGFTDAEIAALAAYLGQGGP
jgi:sulfide dehydrogenase cytochrome subunit